MTKIKATSDTYKALESAYNHFNKKLFSNELPNCMLTLSRKRGAAGYFWGNTWSDETDAENKIDEISLNPDLLQSRDLVDTLSTLVHEMCHLEQHHFGKTSRGGYHNKQWAEMMAKVGLIASDTGQEGGKQTGPRMTHYIEDGGVYHTCADALIESGFTIPWLGVDMSTKAKPKTNSKTKYTCPTCELNAWAKPEANLTCGDCNETMEEDI
jgi:hypothetical protein